MATSIASPAAPAMIRPRVVAATTTVVSRPQHHWGERASALALASVAMVLNASLIGAVIGVPLFLVALSLMMVSMEP
jgi:hypothetical protein